MEAQIRIICRVLQVIQGMVISLFHTILFNILSGCTSGTRTPVSITVNPIQNAVSPVATPSVITCGGSSSLSATTSVGTINWWTAPTGGTLLGNRASGSPLGVSVLLDTTVYYAEVMSGVCVSATRMSVTLIVNPVAIPTNVNASPDSLTCGGGSSFLSGTCNNTIGWFNALIGGTLLGTSSGLETSL